MKKINKKNSNRKFLQILSLMISLFLLVVLAILIKNSSKPMSFASNASKGTCQEKGGQCLSAKNCAQANGSIHGRLNCAKNEICCKPIEPTPSLVEDRDKRVFFTSNHYYADLGGLSGADAKCQTSADNANLGGNWVAWLSDSNTDANQRITHTTGKYNLLDGTLIANGWIDLTDGNLLSPIDVNEFGDKRTDQSSVWTASNLRGEKNHSADPSNFCSDFSKIDESYVWPGNNFFADVGWTAHHYNYQCNGYYPLYCFEK